MGMPTDDEIVGSRPSLRRGGVGVRVRGVEKVFEGGVRALDGIDLEVGAGEFLSVLGPSGCGKSTLLRIVAGLERATLGEVVVGEREKRATQVSPLQKASERRVAFVFQDAHLLPWRNVLQNAALPLELIGFGKTEARERAREALSQVGLSDAVDRYPGQLSGGMRMRVSLARALVTEPGLLLLDEPFAALDEITRQRLDEQLRELWMRRGMTVIFVTHSINEAAYLSERAVVMSKRPGRVVLDRRVELPEVRPASLRGEAAFAREMRVLFEALERGEA
jgi:NitT/TauT family transport system ATP-binding protein